MRNLVLRLGALLALAGCGDQAPVRAPYDATITFNVKAPDGVTSKPAMTVLVVEKTGKSAIVDAWASETPEGSPYGRHNFPPGVTGAAIVAYYEGLLRNAGWGEGDLRVEREAGRLHLLGVTHAGGRADGDEIGVRVEPPSPP